MPSLLQADHIALIQSGVSTIVASRDVRLRPSLMRAVGSSISADGGHITVFLRPSQSRQLLADIRETGQIAVVFSDPPSERTVQVKASHATERGVTDADAPALLAYRLAMQKAIAQVGYGAHYVDAMLSAPLHDLIAVEFSPEQAFNQTPGTGAGLPLTQGA
ncbi:hypothetical protein [Diaphorobacter caeni]|uniref:hypothetical protein n=1 Tax=Diaphorobacter caeni TaxID=2784387 RepID=UPI00188F58E1|nr:hypothetical protein [Diaphorobacter caeni]MBF5002826.1 hypothetical protein [Diaphorobacter caeni]